MINNIPSILQVLPSLNSGGVERGAIDIAIAVKNNGWNSYVISAGGLMKKELDRAKIEHFTLPLESKNPLIIHKNSSKIASIIYENNINIVHARSRAPAWSAYFASKRMKSQFLTTFHGTYNYNNLIKKYYNSIMTRGEVTIAISNFISKHVEENYKLTKNKIKVIPRGIDINKFDSANVSHERILQLFKLWNLPDEATVIMLPGRVTRWKGHKVLIESISQINNDNLICLFVGDFEKKASYKAELETLIRKKKLEKIFRFVGDCQDMPAAYMLSDIIVSSSTDPEAFGRVSVEAQAMGCLIVGSNHGGTLETIINRKTGWLFENSNSINLADVLKTILTLDREKKLEMAKASRKHILTNYALWVMQELTISAYTDLLKVSKL